MSSEDCCHCGRPAQGTYHRCNAPECRGGPLCEACAKEAGLMGVTAAEIDWAMRGRTVPNAFSEERRVRKSNVFQFQVHYAKR